MTRHGSYWSVVRLAAQCTDARVNVVVEGLYEKYPDVALLAAADVTDIEEIVRPCGLGKSKARDISACMKILHEQYHDKVPDDFNALLKLPGVGRKSANLIMGDVFGKPAIVTDTHCIRLVNRIGIVDGIKDPKKVEMALWKLVPPEEGSDFCHRLVEHGREVCTARTKPYCDKCCLADICKKNGVSIKKKKRRQKMKSLKLRDDFYWTGIIDDQLRVFDIIMYTEFGTTYNSYVMKAGDKNSSFRDCKSEVF